MNIGVILAGGVGHRLDNSLPKQFYKLGRKMVIEHTIIVFQNHPEIDEIVVVSNPAYIHYVESLCVRNQYSKVKKILAGGKERYQSSLIAINSYDDPDINILIHDSVRPLVSDRIISDCIENLKHFNAVNVGVTPSDTIIQINDSHIISGIPFRKNLMNGQSPQAFKLGTIKKAYNLALHDPEFRTTDDCSVVHNYLPREEIYVVSGESFNSKLTFKEDLYSLERWLQSKATDLILNDTLSYDSKKLSQKVVVIFGAISDISDEFVNSCISCNAKVYSFCGQNKSKNFEADDAIKNAFKDVFSKEGRIDSVVNIGSVLHEDPLADLEYNFVKESININFLRVIVSAKESFKYLKKTRGHLLFFESVDHNTESSRPCLNSSLKTAITNLPQMLSEEWFDNGIKVNCINHEIIKSPNKIATVSIESKEALSDAKNVAKIMVRILLSDMTGEVINTRHII